MVDLVHVRGNRVRMGNDLVASTGMPFESTTELQRQLLASFAFGMVFAICQIEHLSPPEVHALSITMLSDTFKYSAQQAGAFSHDLVESASGRGNSQIQAIIHRGIDGHRQWSSGHLAELGENITSVFISLGAGRMTPNPSIEGTFKGLRLLPAPPVKRGQLVQ